MIWLLTAVRKLLVMFQAYFRAIRSKGVEAPSKFEQLDSDIKWIYPMPIYTDGEGKDFLPLISHGFRKKATEKHRQHLGVDIMYLRTIPGKKAWPIYDKKYFCPNNIPFLASQDGYVWYSRYSPKYGLNVRLDHGYIKGIPYNTFSQHMSKLFVPMGIEKGKMPISGKRFYVKKGEMLGIVGHSPGNNLNHEHFEIYTATRAKAIDPAPILAKAEILSMRDPRIRIPTGQEIYLASKVIPSNIVTKTALAFGIPAILAVALLGEEIDEYDLAVYHNVV